MSVDAMSSDFTNETEQQILSFIELLPKLDQKLFLPEADDSLKASSVLLILHQLEGVWNLLLTQRSAHLKHHAGQISFPGGRYETADLDLIHTARRETEEEVGIPRDYLEVVSQLENHPTLTGYRIFPFVAITHTLPQLVKQESEVEDIFSVPLEYLINKDNQRFEVVNYNGIDYDIYKILWKNRLIWGATARMIVNLSQYISGDALTETLAKKSTISTDQPVR